MRVTDADDRYYVSGGVYLHAAAGAPLLITSDTLNPSVQVGVAPYTEGQVGDFALEGFGIIEDGQTRFVIVSEGGDGGTMTITESAGNFIGGTFSGTASKVNAQFQPVGKVAITGDFRVPKSGSDEMLSCD